jgi:TPR repeat protein
MPAVSSLLRLAGCAFLLVTAACTGSLPKAASTAAGAGSCRGGGGNDTECHYGDLVECERRCACDDWNSCDRLGFMYDPTFGSQSPSDPARALGLYRRACAGGSNSGCINLGNAYERGTLVAASVDTARELFDHVCQSGPNESIDFAQSSSPAPSNRGGWAPS